MTIAVRKFIHQSTRLPAFIISAFLLVWSPHILCATQSSKTAHLKKLFTAKSIDASLFSEHFLAEISEEEITVIARSLRNKYGKLISIVDNIDYQTLEFENGSARAIVKLDHQNRIDGLRIFYLKSKSSSVDEAVKRFLSLPGTTSITVLKNDQPLLRKGSMLPMAVGSAFKLAVLSALETHIRSDGAEWGHLLTTKSGQTSLPTGILQDWPSGAALTLETVAILMISLSDNTATDMLMHYLGRAAVEKLSPNSIPLLTTREWFLLKHPSRADLVKDYVNSDTKGQRDILESLSSAETLAPAHELSELNGALGLGWTFTTEELAQLITSVERKDILGVAKPPISTDGWDAAGYKGGSTQGVLNATFFLKKDRDIYALSLTQNNGEIALDKDQFFDIAGQIVEQLARQHAAPPNHY